MGSAVLGNDIAEVLRLFITPAALTETLIDSVNNDKVVCAVEGKFVLCVDGIIRAVAYILTNARETVLQNPALLYNFSW